MVFIPESEPLKSPAKIQFSFLQRIPSLLSNSFFVFLQTKTVYIHKNIFLYGIQERTIHSETGGIQAQPPNQSGDRTSACGKVLSAIQPVQTPPC